MYSAKRTQRTLILSYIRLCKRLALYTFLHYINSATFGKVYIVLRIDGERLITYDLYSKNASYWPLPIFYFILVASRLNPATFSVRQTTPVHCLPFTVDHRTVFQIESCCNCTTGNRELLYTIFKNNTQINTIHY